MPICTVNYSALLLIYFFNVCFLDYLYMRYYFYDIFSRSIWGFSAVELFLKSTSVSNKHIIFWSAKKVRKYYYQITSTSNTGKFYERSNGSKEKSFQVFVREYHDTEIWVIRFITSKKNDQLYEKFYLLSRKVNNRSIV